MFSGGRGREEYQLIPSWEERYGEGGRIDGAASVPVCVATDSLQYSKFSFLVLVGTPCCIPTPLCVFWPSVLPLVFPTTIPYVLSHVPSSPVSFLLHRTDLVLGKIWFFFIGEDGT